MKLSEDTMKDDNRNFAFAFMVALGRVVDKDLNEWIELYHKGTRVCYLAPTTKKWWPLRDILKEYRWEFYPYGQGSSLIMWVGDIAIEFDEFKEKGI